MWDGRQLTAYAKDDIAITYTYNGDGLRTSKTVAKLGTFIINGIETPYIIETAKTEYFYVNGQLHYQKTITSDTNGNKLSGKSVYFYYDSNGYLTGIEYNGNNFYTATNLRGDVVAIYLSTGECFAKYEYDAWGNVIAVTDANGNPITDENHIANVNPIRYRGYYYDTETNFYYLQSRYYNPEIGRFLNADTEISGVGGDVLGYNMFSYCMNNPVNMSDPTGNWPSWSNLLKGSAWLAVGITAVCVGVSVLTCGVAAPAMVAVAAVTVGAGALTAVNGAAEIGEAFTGYNVVRDTVFSGNQKAYDAYANTTAAVAEVGTAVCGGWLKSPSTQKKIADKTLQNVIDNPNSVTKLSTDKFHKIANKSSWEFKPTQNNKGYRALKGDMSIRYNMNGTRFDAAHFGGSPYWVISSAKNGTIKIMMP